LSQVLATHKWLMRRIWDLQADADHLKGTEAILRGFKTRFQKTGVAPILIHTVSFTSLDEPCNETQPVASDSQSGTGVLTDKAEGKYESTDIYSDLDIPKIESLPDTQSHRAVDLAIVAAAEEGTD